MKKIVFFVVGILLLVAVPLTVYFVGQQQDIRSRAAPATAISFNPTTITKAVDEQFTVNVNVNTGTNSITAIKIAVVFDSTKLEATSITNGALAPKITASGVVSPGAASITVAAASTTEPISGTGTVAIIHFKGKEPTSTPVTLTFDTTTFASGLQESTNVITTMGTASISITSSGVEETPTPTLMPTMTIAAGISGTPTPTIEQTVATTITIDNNPDTGDPAAPLFYGKAPPGSTIRIYITPAPGTKGKAIVGDDGNWWFVQDEVLPEENYTASVTLNDDPTEIVALKFSILPSGARQEGWSDGIGGVSDEVPVTGAIENTLILLIIGASCIFVSGILYTKAIKPV